MRPQWANDHGVACLQAKTVPKNLICSESAQWLWSCGVRKIPGALITHMGMPIISPWANDHHVAHLQAKTVPVNLICSESAQWLLSSSVRKIPGALNMPMGVPIMPQWANDHAIAHQQAKTVPMNLIWSESAQWLWSSGVRRIPGGLLMPIIDGLAHYAPMGKWPWHCTPTGLDGSNELDLECIDPVVAELWHPQILAGRTDGEHSIVHPFFFGKVGGQK